MKYPKAQWTIFSLCRASDSDRAPKFAKVCQHYGAKSIITDLEDDNKLTIEQTVEVIIKMMQENLNQSFDYLFTHGSNGEYGHPRHIGVHRAVTKMIDDQLLPAKVGFYFNYKKDNLEADLTTLSPKPDSDYILKLTLEELNAKKKIISEMYGYALDGIDVNYCAKTEGFKIIKI